MGPFLTAALVCAGIVAWAAVPPRLPWGAFWERPEFWQAWLPAWLQAAALLALSAAAWRALELWRGERAQQRQTALAADVLRSTRELATAIEVHRQAAAGANGPLAHDAPHAGAALPERLRRAATALRRTAVPARQHFGGEAEAAMLALAAAGEDLAQAHAAGRPPRDTDPLAADLLARATRLAAQVEPHVAREHLRAL